jgi:ribosome-binding factor A
MDNAKVVSAIHSAAAEFINRESNRRSLITVTKVELNPRGLRGRIYVSIFPDLQSHAAIDFLSRMEDDFKDYLRTKIKMHIYPHCVFVQDPNIGGLVAPEEKK